MTTLIIYLSGVVTPLLVFVAIAGYWSFNDWRASRRYQKAWDKFSAEFDALTPEALADYKIRWGEQPWRFAHFNDDRARYFSDRWQYGNTKEI